jgi:hypothetical protein
MDPIFGRANPVETHDERRMEHRRRVFRGAQLRFNRGYGAFECVIRNESANGACLQIGDSSVVPAHFELVLNGEASGRMAHVRWRRTDALGVEFEPRAVLAA